MLAGILELQIMAGIAQLSTDLKRAEQQVQASTDRMGRSVATLESAFGKLGSTLSLGLAFEAVRRLSDDYTKLTAQIRIATKTQAEYANGLAEVRRISTESQASITATGALYTRLTNSLGAYGATQKQVANITETVSLGLKAYGATSVEAASAMLQLSQAFASNRLGGDEFRAMMESMPNMMRTLATSMGVPFEALKVLSAEGKITAKEMMKAWDDPALIASLQKQANMTRTITGEITVLRNNVMMLVGELMGASKGTQGITAVLHAMSDSVLMLAKHIEQLAAYATIMATLFAGKWLLAKQEAIRVSVALREATIMEAASEAARAKVAVAASEQIAAAKQLEVYAAREAFIATQVAAEKTLSIFVLSTEARIAAETRLAALTATVTEAEVAAIAVERELALTRAASTAATEARAAAEISALAKVGNFVKGMVGGTMGLIGLALFAGYEIADYMGLIDRIFMGAEERIKKLRAEIVAAREISGQIKTPTPGIAEGFSAVPGIAADAVAAYMKVVGDLPKEFSSFIKDGSFLFTKDFMSKEQEKAAKMLEINTAFYAAMDRLQAQKGLSNEKYKAVEIILQETRMEKLAELNDKEKTIHESKMAMMVIELDAKISADGKTLSEEEKVNKAWAELDFKKLSAIEKRNELDAHYSALTKARRLDEMAADEKQAEVMVGINAHGITQIDTLDKEIAAQKLHNDSIGKSAEQIANLKTEAEALLIVKMENDAKDLSSEATSNAVAATKLANIQAEIAKMKELRDLKAGAAPLEAAKKLADEERKANEKLWHDIDGFAHTAFDNIFDKGKNVFEELGKVIKKSILDMLYQMTIKQWLIPVSITGGGTASGLAGAADMVGGGTGTGSWLSAGKSMYDGFAGAFTYDATATTGLSGMFNAAAQSSYGASMGLSNTFYTAPGTGAAYGATSSAGSALGTAGSYVGAGLAGIGVGSMIAGNKTVIGLDGTTSSAIGAAIGAVIAGPIGAFFGGVAGGLFDAAFGSGPTVFGATTLAGSFSQKGFAGQYQTPWSQEGGWFSSGSSGVSISPVAQAQSDAFKNIVVGTKSVFDNLIAVSGEVNKSLTGWTFSINQQVATQEQQKQLVTDLATSMGNFLIPSLKQLMVTGENLADTAVRLRDEFVLTNTIATLMSKSFATAFGASGLASMSARDNLVSMLGGVQSANTKMQGFYQTFFSDTERRNIQLIDLTHTLTQLGVTSIPQTNSQFRALMQAQDLTTAAGRGMFAALLDLAPAFDQVTKLTNSLNGSLQSLSTDLFASQLEYDRLMGRIQGGSTKAPTTNAELLDELKAMRAELAALRDASDATAKNTKQTADTLRNVSQDGTAFTTVPA